MWQIVARTHSFRFRGTFDVGFVLHGLAHKSAPAKRDHSAGVALHVGMNGESRVHPGSHFANIIGSDYVVVI